MLNSDSARLPSLYPSILVPIDACLVHIEPVSLHEDVRLRNLGREELDHFNSLFKHDDALSLGLTVVPSSLVFLEIRLPKMQDDHSDAADEDPLLELRKIAVPLADKALSSLRLLQPGSIGFRGIVKPLADCFQPAYSYIQTSYEPQFQFPEYPYTYIPPTKNEIDKLLRFAKLWAHDLDGVPGLRWLNKAYAERNFDDRLAHLVFGLEQVLLSDESEKSYLSFKMALRGSWLLEPDPKKRTDLFRMLKKAYGLRSKIAHGGLKKPFGTDELRITTDVELALRNLINLRIDRQGLFSPQKLNEITLGVPF